MIKIGVAQRGRVRFGIVADYLIQRRPLTENRRVDRAVAYDIAMSRLRATEEIAAGRHIAADERPATGDDQLEASQISQLRRLTQQNGPEIFPLAFIRGRQRMRYRFKSRHNVVKCGA